MARWWRTRLPAQEMRVQSLGWEDPLEEEMAIHCSILAWEILWTEEPGGLQSMGSQKNQTQQGTSHLTHTRTHTHARDKSPHAHTHTHARAHARTCTHTYLPLDQFPLGFPTSRLQLDQQRLKGSWYHVDHSRVRRPCGILFGAASSFVTFTFSVCPATWSVFPTLSGWQTRFARGQDHQPLSAWPKNQDSWTKKWRWTPHSPFNTSLNDEAVPYPSFWKVTSVFTPRSCSVFLLSHTSAHCHKCPSRLNHTPLPSLSERCLFCCDCWLLSPSTAGQAPLTQGLVTVTCLYFAYFNQE